MRHATGEALDDRYFVHLVRWNSVHKRRELVLKEIRSPWWEPCLHERVLFVCHHKWRFDGHSASSARWAVVPHMSSHMDLQVPFCCESFPANCAFEGFVTSVRSDMNLQGTCAAETFLANLALVLQWCSS